MDIVVWAIVILIAIPLESIIVNSVAGLTGIVHALAIAALPGTIVGGLLTWIADSL